MTAEYSIAQDYWMPDGWAFYGAVAQAQANNDVSIVIHGTGSNSTDSAISIAKFFAGSSDKRSSHFIVDQSGAIAQCIHLADGAGANCCPEVGYDNYWNSYLRKYSNLNRCTISIEHCSNSDNSSYTAIQLERSFALVRWLCQSFSIPAGRIKTHASIDPISRARCPGSYPMDSLINFIQNGGSMIPQGWTDTIVNNDPHLVAPNGFYFRGGFRNYVMSRYWDAGDMPLELEHSASPLEQSNTSLGGGVRQVCTFSTLEMLQQQGNQIIRGWTGQERLWQEQKISELTAALQSVNLPPNFAVDLQNASKIIGQLEQDIAQHAQSS